MYITAHRIWSRARDQTAIHAFLYRHREPLPIPLDIAHVADSDPGELEASIVEIPLGGNEVQSYLDVVAAHEPILADLTGELDRLLSIVRSTSNAFPQHNGSTIASRFYANPKMSAESRSDEAAELIGAVRTLYERQLSHRSISPTPLIVRIERQDNALRVRLAPESAERIRAQFEHAWRGPQSVTISEDTLNDFEAVYGSILQHLVPVVTGLDVSQLEALGGVQIIDPSGKPIRA